MLAKEIFILAVEWQASHVPEFGIINARVSIGGVLLDFFEYCSLVLLVCCVIFWVSVQDVVGMLVTLAQNVQFFVEILVGGFPHAVAYIDGHGT